MPFKSHMVKIPGLVMRSRSTCPLFLKRESYKSQDLNIKQMNLRLRLTPFELCTAKMTNQLI